MKTYHLLAKAAGFSLLSIILATSNLVHADIDPTSPEAATQAVEKKLAELVQLLKVTELPEDKAEAEKMMTDLIDSNLTAIVDFQRIVKRIMGKHFGGATKAQRNHFLQVFKDSLVNSYSRFMLNTDLKSLADRIKYQVKPAPASKRKGRAQVTVVFKIDDNSYQAVHSMFYHTSKNDWFLENLIVGGINLGINYRTQFDRMMVKYQGDYDKVIAEWAGEATNTG